MPVRRPRDPTLLRTNRIHPLRPQLGAALGQGSEADAAKELDELFARANADFVDGARWLEHTDLRP